VPELNTCAPTLPPATLAMTPRFVTTLPVRVPELRKLITPADALVMPPLILAVPFVTLITDVFNNRPLLSPPLRSRLPVLTTRLEMPPKFTNEPALVRIPLLAMTP